MIEWKGSAVALSLTERLREDITKLKARGVVPKLAVVRVGAREDDLSYERSLQKRFAKAGAWVSVTELPETVSQEQLEACIASLRDDPSVHGILPFSPLPKPLSNARLRELLPPCKDVDGLSDGNAFCVYAGETRADVPGFPPCTPQAVLEILDYYGYDLTGKKVTVVGRSAVVGKPLAMLLLKRNATVTVCHTKTKDLPAACRDADLLIACAGKAHLIGREHVRAGMAVVDVGIHVVGDTLCGDVDASAVSDVVAALTPVPGGVGAVTTSVLLKHTVAAASRLCKD